MAIFILNKTSRLEPKSQKRVESAYKALENKTVVVEDFLDKPEALESITQAIARYQQHRHALFSANRQGI